MATRMLLAVPLSFTLMTACLAPVTSAGALEGEEGLKASVVFAESEDLSSADGAHSDLYELYLPVLFRAANGLDEFSENFRACDPALWSPEYFLFDVGGNGVPELMVRTNAFSGVNVVHVFSAKQGKVVSLGSYWEWFGGSAGNKAGDLYAAGWHEGNSYVNGIAVEDGRVHSRFLKSGRESVDSPSGEMQVVNDFLAAHDASWIDASDIHDYSRLDQQARYELSQGSMAVASAETYTGKAQTPSVTVTFGKKKLQEGVDYDVSYKDNVDAGLATATVTGLGNYRGTLSARFTIAKADLSKASVALAKAGAYTGSAKTPDAQVKLASDMLKPGRDYSVSYKDNTHAGTATAVVLGRGNYQGSKTVKFTIAKAKNPMKPTASDKTLSEKSLAKKARTFTAIRFQQKARGKVTFTNVSSSQVLQVIGVNRSDGTLMVKKGAKARSYAVKVRVSASGDRDHLASSKTLRMKVNVV